MKIYKKKVLTLFALTLMVTSLLLINMNEPTTAQPSTDLIHLDGPPLTPIHLNSNKTLTPVHMHYKEGLIEQTPPNGTEWHELYPNFCADWNITNWIDVDYDTYLSPNDQINMTDKDGNSTFYHIDRVTYTLNISQLSPEPFERKFIEFKGPPDYPNPLSAPVCTYWHEVHPNYTRVYHIIASTGPLQFCTNITLQEFVNGMPVGLPTMWHVDDVATDLILREKITDPICTWWHAIYPEEEYCKWYHITSWEDIETLEEPGYGMLSPGDQIDMVEEETGIKTWYFVDRVTVTLNVSWYYEPTIWMKIELKTWWFEQMYEAFKHPLYSLWHEVCPVYSNVYNLTGWDWMIDDNCNGVLDVCDYIWLQNVDTGMEDRWHIDDITYDLILNRKMGDPYCTWWHELYPECCVYDYHVIGWEDNDDELLSPCDNLTMAKSPTGFTDKYHVENVTLTLNLSVTDWTLPEPPPERIYLELQEVYEKIYFAKIEPWDTTWVIICPIDYIGDTYYIWDWIDDCNGVLSYCDDITLYDPVYQNFVYGHVDELAIDIIVKKIGELPPPPPTLYWKESYLNYTPSGVPDFDENQGPWMQYCAPSAVANSLWWLDSRFHPSNLTTKYPAATGEHDPSNVVPFIDHLAWLMDTNGQRTGTPGKMGTVVQDIETGIAQYLSWNGENPLGDVNGDGIVNMTDWHHVNAMVNGTQPFDISGDIYPETVTGPFTADNVVNMSDLWLVGNHTGETGKFYERTWMIPGFDEVAHEVEVCEDVVLCLKFYDNSTGDWIPCTYPEWELGHCVTVAGVNSTSIPRLIAISDPDNDAFEAGLTPGRSPGWHPFPHGPGSHNNASRVSHDIYNVTLLPPWAPGKWALEGYVGGPGFPWNIAVVEAAIITSPVATHDVAVIDVTTSKTGCLPMETVGENKSVKMDVTVENQGGFMETFNVTVYADATVIRNQTITNLPPGNTTSFTFSWDTTGFAKGNYTISAVADTVPSETDTADNTFTYGDILVTLVGDVNGDQWVDWKDLLLRLVPAYNSHGPDIPSPGDPASPSWDPNCDFNDDNWVDWKDLLLELTPNYNQHWP